MRERYLAASTFDEFLAAVTTNRDLWLTVHNRARIPDAVVERARAATGGRPVHLLVLSEDWCGDAVNTVPVVARLAERVEHMDMRILARDANPDLMDSHLTGQSRSIPVVMALDENYREWGWWGPRPRELQEWVLGPGQALNKQDRYREVRRWYARDLGITTLEEVVGLISREEPPARSALRAAGP